MANVHIEWGYLGAASRLGALPMFEGMPVTVELVTTDTTSTNGAPATPSNGSGAKPAFRITTDAAVYIAWGAAPDSSSGARVKLMANVPEYFSCEPGDKVDITTV